MRKILCSVVAACAVGILILVLLKKLSVKNNDEWPTCI